MDETFFISEKECGLSLSKIKNKPIQPVNYSDFLLVRENKNRL
jgi:hypothetical protein